jgi:hypothetical protein
MRAVWVRFGSKVWVQTDNDLKEKIKTRTKLEAADTVLQGNG